jgi:quinol monooxygenase YgiN
MHQGATDPSLFLFHENWTSKAALEAHFETPRIRTGCGSPRSRSPRRSG